MCDFLSRLLYILYIYPYNSCLYNVETYFALYYYFVNFMKHIVKNEISILIAGKF